MDGTLLQSNCRISETNVNVIKESDIPFTLVSARSPMEMTDVIDKLELTEPQIAFNGGLIFQKIENDLKIIKEDAIENASVKKILAEVKDSFPKVSCSFYDLDKWYVEKIDRGVKYEAELGGQTPNLTNFVSLLKQESTKIYKIMLICFDKDEMKTLVERMEQLNKGDMSVNQSSAEYLEITSPLAQKSRGIRYIQKLENLEKLEMAAFGDGYNDLSMFETVGTPIVMDNALPGVKDYGKHITKDNNHDGVAFGIKEYLKPNQ